MTEPEAVQRARDLADRVLRPQAERADTEGVRREVVDVLGRAGLLGLDGPREAGGGQAPPPVLRAVTELLAGADGATWFVTTQHTSPLRALAASGNAPLRRRHLRGACTGELLCGIAIAHLRRPGPPAVRAVRTAGGWRFDGQVGWATSWGLADLVMLAGLSQADELVLALVPARDQPGLSASAPLALAAMQGTATVRLAVDGLEVADADVLEVSSAAAWREADRVRTANASPAVLGLLAELVRRTREVAERRGDDVVAAAADRLDAQREQVRTAAYALVDDVAPHEALAERLALRAQALDLAVRGAAALVAATGGGGLATSAAPQRLAREALFHLVQAQTVPVRHATLGRLLPDR